MANELWGRRLHCGGGIGSATVSAELFRFGGIEYGLDSAMGIVYVRDDETYELVPVTDEATIAGVRALAAEDAETLRARAQHVQELASGDPILVEVIEMHLAFRNGHIDSPHVEDGVAFYLVGQNASHQWSLGTKDGRSFVQQLRGGVRSSPSRADLARVDARGGEVAIIPRPLLAEV